MTEPLYAVWANAVPHKLSTHVFCAHRIFVAVRWNKWNKNFRSSNCNSAYPMLQPYGTLQICFLLLQYHYYYLEFFCPKWRPKVETLDQVEKQWQCHRRVTFVRKRDEIEEEALVVTGVVGGVGEAAAADLNGLVMWDSLNNLSWSPS